MHCFMINAKLFDSIETNHGTRFRIRDNRKYLSQWAKLCIRVVGLAEIEFEPVFNCV